MPDAAKPGTLFVVATPIGNLEDLSPRAARVLAEADVVAAEDTRVSGRLLARVGAKKGSMLSYREENERRLAPKLVERLLGGEDVALVCDAGTPGVSDPGYRLVHGAAEAGVEVVAIAGPSAVIALLSVSGLPTDRFSFEGFLPSRSGQRRKALEALRGAARTVVVYESPRRLLAMLEDVAGVLGDPLLAVGRELTKVHEEVLRGKASEVAATLQAREGQVRGEIAVAIHLEAAQAETLSGEALESAIRERLAQGLRAKDIAAELKPLGVTRRDVYRIAEAAS